MRRNAIGAALCKKSGKSGKRQHENIVCRSNQEIVLCNVLVDGELDVRNGSQPLLIGSCPIVDDPDGPLAAITGPLLEFVDESLIRYQRHLIDRRDTVDGIQ